MAEKPKGKSEREEREKKGKDQASERPPEKGEDIKLKAESTPPTIPVRNQGPKNYRINVSPVVLVHRTCGGKSGVFYKMIIRVITLIEGKLDYPVEAEIHILCSQLSERESHQECSKKHGLTLLIPGGDASEVHFSITSVSDEKKRGKDKNDTSVPVFASVTQALPYVNPDDRPRFRYTDIAPEDTLRGVWSKALKGG